MLLIGCRDDIEKVPFWLKPSKLLLSVMPFSGKNYVTNIVTGKTVQWASCFTIKPKLIEIKAFYSTKIKKADFTRNSKSALFNK